MNLIKYFLVIVTAFSFTCQAQKLEATHYNDFDDNPYLTKKMRHAFKHYLLPVDHPLKEKLDAIFLNARAIQNVQSFQKAGFRCIVHKPRSFIRVTMHPDMPGYLFKIYLDSDLKEKRRTPGWQWLARRCKGAEKVREVIRKKKCKYFDVADKWLYPLPVNPAPPLTRDYIRQPVILVVKDMQLVSKAQNMKAWQTQITKKHLDELYTIISHAKGSSYRPDNIWLNKDGKFCFIDTEYPQGGPDFEGIRMHLNSEMRAYWDKLVRR